MSSIDEKRRKLLVEFYEEVILPLAAHPELAAFEPRTSEDEESFFFVRTKTRFDREDFEVRLANEAQVVEALEVMWTATPLAQIPCSLMKLCKHFQKTEEKSEVSEFVYEMF